MSWSESKESLNHSRGTSEAQLLGSLPSSEVVSAVRDWCSHYVTSVCLVHSGSVHWECKYSYSEGIRVHIERKKKTLEPHERLFWRQMRLRWYGLFLSLQLIWQLYTVYCKWQAADPTACNSCHTDGAEMYGYQQYWLVGWENYRKRDHCCG